MRAKSAYLTPEDIFHAADTLAEAGEVATTRRVLEFLGRGSFSTISKYLEEWRKAKLENLQIPLNSRQSAYAITLQTLAKRDTHERETQRLKKELAAMTRRAEAAESGHRKAHGRMMLWKTKYQNLRKHLSADPYLALSDSDGEFDDNDPE